MYNPPFCIGNLLLFLFFFFCPLHILIRFDSLAFDISFYRCMALSLWADGFCFDCILWLVRLEILSFEGSSSQATVIVGQPLELNMVDGKRSSECDGLLALYTLPTLPLIRYQVDMNIALPLNSCSNNRQSAHQLRL